jgi:hypothetical protein
MRLLECYLPFFMFLVTTPVISNICAKEGRRCDQLPKRRPVCQGRTAKTCAKPEGPVFVTFLLPRLQALIGLDNVLRKPISLRYKEIFRC